MIKQIYLLAILPTLMMTGCNAGEDDTPNTPVNTFPEDGSIQVTTTVSNAAVNRATGATDFTGSDFKLCIDPEEKKENGNDVNADYHYQLTVKKSTAGNWDVFEGTYGTSTPANLLNGKIPLWAGPQVRTDVNAYANYLNTTNMSLLLDQSTADKSNAVDLLYFYKSLLPGTELDGNKKLAIDFTHRLSQLNIILKFGSEFNRVDNSTMDAALIKLVGIYEMKYEYTFDVNTSPSANGASIIYPIPTAAGLITTLSDLTSDPTSTPHIIPYIYKKLEQGTNPTITYTALVVPQEVAGGSHLVVISLYPMKSDGKADTTGTSRNFVYTVSASSSLTFESGKAYNLTLTVGKDQITDAVLTPEAWTTGSNDEIITD